VCQGAPEADVVGQSKRTGHILYGGDCRPVRSIRVGPQAVGQIPRAREQLGGSRGRRLDRFLDGRDNGRVDTLDELTPGIDDRVCGAGISKCCGQIGNQRGVLLGDSAVLPVMGPV
jgi:hypothetical protein